MPTCELTYNGLLLNSYSYVVFSAFLFQLLTFVATSLIIPFTEWLYMTLKGFFTRKSAKGKVQKKTNSANSASLKFLGYQVVYSYVAFIYLCVTVSGDVPNASLWTRYTNIYGAYVNGVALTPVITIFFFIFNFWLTTLSDDEFAWDLDFPEDAEKTLKALGFLSYLPLLPAIYSHIIPGIFLFAWFPLLLITGFAVYFAGCISLWSYLSQRKQHSQVDNIRNIVQDSDRLFTGTTTSAAIAAAARAKVAEKSKLDNQSGVINWNVVITLLKIGFRIACTVLFQTLFNYMAIYYSTEKNYLLFPDSDVYSAIISRDWQLRSQTLCLLEEKVDAASSFFIVFNWLG